MKKFILSLAFILGISATSSLLLERNEVKAQSHDEKFIKQESEELLSKAKMQSENSNLKDEFGNKIYRIKEEKGINNSQFSVTSFKKIESPTEIKPRGISEDGSWGSAGTGYIRITVYFDRVTYKNANCYKLTKVSSYVSDPKSSNHKYIKQLTRVGQVYGPWPETANQILEYTTGNRGIDITVPTSWKPVSDNIHSSGMLGNVGANVTATYQDINTGKTWTSIFINNL